MYRLDNVTNEYVEESILTAPDSVGQERFGLAMSMHLSTLVVSAFNFGDIWEGEISFPIPSIRIISNSPNF
jgi:hypothetical protein